MNGRLLAALALGVALAAPAAAHVDLQANLDTMQEVPAPTFPPEILPNGTATLELGNDNALEYEIQVRDLTGPAVAAHIHRGAAGTPGPIEITLDHTALAGTTAPLTDEQLRALFRGDLYVNVHTDANLAGEIRGQIVVPPPQCDCDGPSVSSRGGFLRCVRNALRQLERSERRSAEAKALRRAAKKSACRRRKVPGNSIACCLPLNPFENVVTDVMCAGLTEQRCTNSGGRSLGTGTSCLPQNTCSSPTGAFVGGVSTDPF